MTVQSGGAKPAELILSSWVRVPHDVYWFPAALTFPQATPSIAFRLRKAYLREQHQSATTRRDIASTKVVYQGWIGSGRLRILRGSGPRFGIAQCGRHPCPSKSFCWIYLGTCPYSPSRRNGLSSANPTISRRTPSRSSSKNPATARRNPPCAIQCAE